MDVVKSLLIIFGWHGYFRTMIQLGYLFSISTGFIHHAILDLKVHPVTCTSIHKHYVV